MPTLALQASVKFNLTQKLDNVPKSDWNRDETISKNLFISALKKTIPILKSTDINIYNVTESVSRRRQLSVVSRKLQSSSLNIDYSGMFFLLFFFDSIYL
jgi:hypothetical protein